MKLKDLAHTRSGDKGNISNIAVITYRPEDYPYLEAHLTAEIVKEFFGPMVKGKVERFTLPQLGALNFVMYDALGGGVTRSLSIDPHGKTLSTVLLDLEI